MRMSFLVPYFLTNRSHKNTPTPWAASLSLLIFCSDVVLLSVTLSPFLWPLCGCFLWQTGKWTWLSCGLPLDIQNGWGHVNRQNHGPNEQRQQTEKQSGRGARLPSGVFFFLPFLFFPLFRQGGLISCLFTLALLSWMCFDRKAPLSGCLVTPVWCDPSYQNSF